MAHHSLPHAHSSDRNRKPHNHSIRARRGLAMAVWRVPIGRRARPGGWFRASQLDAKAASSGLEGRRVESHRKRAFGAGGDGPIRARRRATCVSRSAAVSPGSS